jgi:hypothetical protein
VALNQPGRPPLSTALLHEAEAVLGAVQGSAGERYRAWLDYVRLADRAWQARQAGAAHEACAAEAAIQTAFEQQRTLLAPHLLIDWMVRTSKGQAALPITAKGEGRS